MYGKLPREHPYRKHSANFAATKKGLVQAERFHKDSIRRGDDAATSFAARIHMFMVAVAAEARLRKILSEPGGFNERECKFILSRTSQVDRWISAVEYAFRRHYAVPIHLEMDESSLSTNLVAQYTTLTNLLDSDLASVIQDRNKTAHAQWTWHLNSKESTFTKEAPTPLNYCAIKCRSNILDSISDIIHVLTVSEPTFQRDYQQTYSAIIKERGNLSGSGYPVFCESLRRTRRHVS